MRFGDDRAPLEMTKLSSSQIIRVCPHCKAGNQFGKNWYAGKCRACDNRFNRDEALPQKEMEGKSHIEVGDLIDPNKVAMKGDMETRAYAFAEERDQIARDGIRKRSFRNPLNHHFDGDKYR